MLCPGIAARLCPEVAARPPAESLRYTTQIRKTKTKNTHKFKRKKKKKKEKRKRKKRKKHVSGGEGEQIHILICIHETDLSLQGRLPFFFIYLHDAKGSKI